MAADCLDVPLNTEELFMARCTISEALQAMQYLEATYAGLLPAATGAQ